MNAALQKQSHGSALNARRDKPMRILYVEDNWTDIDLTSHQLGKDAPQFRLETASTLADAYKRLEKLPSEPLDLVLIDVRLPDGDGLTLLNWIREQAFPVAVVIVTGTGDEQVAVAALKAGADDYVAKRQGYLERLLLTLESAHQHYRAGVARQARPLNVLYGEHDTATISHTRQYLATHAGHIRLDYVSTSWDLLSRINETAGTPGYDAVLLDCRLPEFDVLEILRELRLAKQLDIPVVLLTNPSDEPVAMRASEFGLTSYLTKNPGYLFHLPRKLEFASDRAEMIQREKALRESEERYRAVFEFSVVGMSQSSPASGQFQRVNDAFCQIIGYTREELLERSFRDITHPEDRESDWTGLQRLIRGEISEYYVEKRYIRKDGRVIWVNVQASIIRDSAGNALHTVALVQDITERKAVEQELRESEAKNRAMLMAMPDLMFLMSKDGIYLDYSARDERDLYVSPREFIGKSFKEVLPGELSDSVERGIGETVRTGEPAMLEYTLSFDGEERNYECRIVPCDDDKVLSIVRNITEQKLAAKARSESRQQYESLVHSIDGVVWECDYPALSFTFVSNQVERILGYPVDQWLREPNFWRDHLHPDDRDAVLQGFDEASKRGGDLELDYRMIAADGRDVWLRGIITVEAFEDGHARLRGLMVDITDRKQEEALRAGQSQILEMVAAAVPLTDILTEIVLLTEREAKGMICSILLVSEDGLHLRDGAAPNLPESYRKAVDGAPIGPRAGSCGTAVYTGKQVVVTDINEDSLWDDYRDLAQPLGLRACWSTPIRSSQGEVLGAFAMYYHEPATPSARERRLIDIATHIAGIAIERQLARERLRESEERFRQLTENIGVVFFMGEALDENPPGRILHVSAAYDTIWGRSREELYLNPRAWFDSVHPDDRKRLEPRLSLIAKAEFDEEFRIERPDGAIRWVHERVFPIYNENGEIYRIAGIIEDITERKRADASLQAALAEVEQLREQLHVENVYLQEEIMVAHNFGEIIGRSETLQKTLRQAEQVARLDTTVLLLGETGTGKELLAHAIHSLNPRKHRPLVKVNCATLPAHLIESELFGHEKGAFTGALARRVGRFEIANGGTVFLDEIGELPLDLQAKLLRVLQEGEFERLGSSTTLKVDVRVLAATNRDLEEAVRKGTFRSDLYYRLNIFPIVVPPLRERQEDIPMLVTHFLKQLGLKMGKRIDSIPQETMDALQNYPWPGNIRELRNVIERAAIVTQGSQLRLLDNLEYRPVTRETPAQTPLAMSVAVETLDESQRHLIERTLEKTYWRVEGPVGAAALLGVHPNTLRSRMKKLGIAKPKFKEQA
jgi:formate hydrogenlyase transcriptional activator